MTLQEKAEWLNKFDAHASRNWGVIQVDGEELLGQIGPARAQVTSPREIVFILLGEISDLVKRGGKDELCKEIFDVLKGLSLCGQVL